MCVCMYVCMYVCMSVTGLRTFWHVPLRMLCVRHLMCMRIPSNPKLRSYISRMKPSSQSARSKERLGRGGLTLGNLE